MTSYDMPAARSEKGAWLGNRVSRSQLLSTAFAGLLIALAMVLNAPVAFAANKAAPGFTINDLDGKPLSLSDFKGQWVVLEWTNPGCPFVQKHYKAGNMQATQQFAIDKKVAWIQVNSTTPSHGDYLKPIAMKEWNAEMKAKVSRSVLDEKGTIGRAYGAKTTPQIVLIDPAQEIVYNGAIDSIRSANPADIEKATNYAKKAIAEGTAGKRISEPTTTPYGCSVKY
jgi:hypothetical protein